MKLTGIRHPLVLGGAALVILALALVPLAACRDDGRPSPGRPGTQSASHYYTFSQRAPIVCNRAHPLSGAARLIWRILPGSVPLKHRTALFAGNLVPAGPDSVLLETVLGRERGRKALRMDRATLQTGVFPVTDRRFSVEMWFRHHGMGSIPGPNNRSAGTLVALGDGVRNGWRLSMTFPAATIDFVIGQKKMREPAHVRSTIPVVADVWHHVAATWDGSRMRLYLDGALVGQKDYSGPYLAPNPDGRFRIGYVGNGLGSVNFDVDQLTIRGASLSHAALLTNAYPILAQSRWAAVVQRLVTADSLYFMGRYREAGALYTEVSSGAPAEIRGMATIRRAAALLARGNADSAFVELARVVMDASAGATNRRWALNAALGLRKNNVLAANDPEVFESLLRVVSLPPTSEAGMRLDFARQARQSNNIALAAWQYEKVLQIRNILDSTRVSVEFELARFRLEHSQYDRARKTFQDIAVNGAYSPIHRALAHFQIGQSLERERRFAEAADRYRIVASDRGFPSHLRWEARERTKEVARLAEGLPRFDEAATRTVVAEAPQAHVALYTSPRGNDAWTGTRERPFATLERARNEIRERRKAPGGDTLRFEVVLRGGIYRRRSAFYLTSDDSGREGARIVYRSEKGESPVLSGSMVLTGAKEVQDADILARLPESARPHVVQFDLRENDVPKLPEMTPIGGISDGYSPVVQLYSNGGPLVLARWPNRGWVHTGRVIEGTDTESEGGPVFEIQDPRPAKWQNIDQVWMHGQWQHMWADYAAPIASVEHFGKRIRMQHAPPRYGVGAGMPYFYFNVLEELDAPGEWYVDREKELLFVYPAEPDARYELTVAKGPLLDFQDVSHLEIRGVAINGSQAHGVVVRNGRNVLLRGITVRNVARAGVIIKGGNAHALVHCYLHSIGGTAVIVLGGDRKTLSPSEHVVENCRIHDFARSDRGLTHGIELHGVGARVAHNLIYDGPDAAIRLYGNDHIIEYNEVHDVVRLSDDMGAFNVGADPLFRGNVIRYNYWHHIGNKGPLGQNAVRLDDAISGTIVYGNVFYKARGGVFGCVNINGGRDNWIDNNVFIDCARGIGIFQWNQAQSATHFAREDVIRTFVALKPSRALYDNRYPELANLHGDLTVNHLWRNVIVGSAHPILGDEGNQDLVDNIVTWEDPGFTDAARRDFGLDSSAPAVRWTAFRPIPFELMGRYPSDLIPAAARN